MRALSKTIAALALIGLTIPATASAQPKPAAPQVGAQVGPKAPTGVAGDVSCLLTMVALGQQKERQEAARLGVYFFSGRISARAPGLDMPTAMRAEAAKLDAKALEAEAHRCLPMVGAAVQNVQTGLNAMRPASAPAPAGAPPAAALPR